MMIQTHGKMQPVQHKLYKKRWLVLATFIILSATSGFQYIQYAPLSGTMCQLWSVSQGSINLFTVIYETTYLTGIIPANWLLLKCGLFRTCILAAGFTLLGYWIAVCGQVLAGAGDLWILGVPPLLAGRWFGANEVATATSLGVLGNQIGIGLGFLVPPLIVDTQPWINDTMSQSYNNGTLGLEFLASVQNQLRYLFSGLGTVAIVALLGIVIGNVKKTILSVIRDSPPTAPSSAQQGARAVEKLHENTLTEIIFMLTKCKGFFILFLTYGINTGLFYAFSTTLAPIVVHFIPNAANKVGAMGMTMITCGIICSVLIGPVLDRTHKYKLITLVFYGMAGGIMIAFIAGRQFGNRIRSGEIASTLFLMQSHIKSPKVWRGTFLHENMCFSIPCLIHGNVLSLFAIAGALGFFNTGYLPLGFEFGVELTYPASEANVGGLLNWSAQAFGISMTFLAQYLIDIGWAVGAVSMFAGCLATGFILTTFIPENLNRQAAEARARIVRDSQCEAIGLTQS